VFLTLRPNLFPISQSLCPITQAQKFGVEMVIPNEAEHLSIAADDGGR
jgi:hypothetical protein